MPDRHSHRRRRHDRGAVFLTVVTLVPFAIGPDLALLRRIGPAILWLGALLASLLTLDRLFASDHDDGSLDLILMGRIRWKSWS
jgi:heme exporter protein B